MAISVTEYLGNRTDIDNPAIQIQSEQNRICPFNGLPCEKIIKGNKPVCSIRNFGRNKAIPNEQLDSFPFWIVCEHRLCSTSMKSVGGRQTLSGYQANRLLQIARVVFTDAASPSNVFVRSEVLIKVNEEKHQDMHADFVMTYIPADSEAYVGKRRVIIEIQGGGETSNTGKLTKYIDSWEKEPTPTNEQLRALIPKVGILATNAWRRQQEQVLVKSNVADLTPNVDGFVLCIGSYLYQYLNTKLKLDQLSCRQGEDWKVAIISFKEDNSTLRDNGPIPLIVDKVIKIPTYIRFISAITNQGIATPTAFNGDFVGLDNQIKTF